MTMPLPKGEFTFAWPVPDGERMSAEAVDGLVGQTFMLDTTAFGGHRVSCDILKAEVIGEINGEQVLRLTAIRIPVSYAQDVDDDVDDEDS